MFQVDFFMFRVPSKKVNTKEAEQIRKWDPFELSSESRFKCDLISTEHSEERKRSSLLFVEILKEIA